MIEISSAVPTICSKIKPLPKGNFLKLLTFKKDRSLTIVKLADNSFHVLENGYEEDSYFVDDKKLKKLLKRLIRKEFPRSNKAHLQTGKASHS